MKINVQTVNADGIPSYFEFENVQFSYEKEIEIEFPI